MTNVRTRINEKPFGESSSLPSRFFAHDGYALVDSVITHEKITWGQIEGCDYYQPFTMQLTI